MLRLRIYYIFIISLCSNLIIVIIDFGFDWEHTLVCFCTEVLILVKKVTVIIVLNFIID